MRYRGGFVRATAPTVTGAQSTPGIWTQQQVNQYSGASTWPPALAFNGWTNLGSSWTTSVSSRAAVSDTTGNMYLMTFQSSNRTIGILKMNASGTKLWERTYNFTGAVGSSNTVPLAGAFAPDGTLTVLFQANYAPLGTNRTVFGLMRVSPSTGVASAIQYYFNSANNITPYGLAIDGSGNIYVSVDQDYRPHLIKIDSSLAISWTRATSYTTTGGQGGIGSRGNVALSPDGNKIYWTERASGGATGAHLLVYDPSGTLTASYTVNLGVGSPAQESYGLATDPSGNVYIRIRSSNTGGIFKYDSSLQPSWRATYFTNNPAYAPFYATDTGIHFTATGVWQQFYGILSPGGGVLNSMYTQEIDPTICPQMSGVSGATFFSASTNGIAVFQMPQNNRGSGLYQYTPTASAYMAYYPGPTITVSTLAPLTSYTPASVTPLSFTAYAATATEASVSTTYTKTSVNAPNEPGSALYDTPGTYTWIAPFGVSSVSVVAVGGGGGGGGGYGGGGAGGGGLGWRNSNSVTAGTGYTVVVGAGGSGGGTPFGSGTGGGNSSFAGSTVIGYGGGNGNGGSFGQPGSGGSYNGGGGGAGGSGAQGGGDAGGGAGGAGGYSGSGGAGGGFQGNGSAGSGGGGGGGNGGNLFIYCCGNTVEYTSGGNGGTVGILGQGSSGTAGSGAGSTSGSFNYGASGGGGGIGYYQQNTCFPYAVYFGGNSGTKGAVRIMWGTSRSFPSTNAGAP